jgi:tetratricopeptide (TPR) repeat protein
MTDNPRIEELRRRVQKDPASIAFAQLAEEYRRAGSYEDAIDVCRSGLEIHPGYLSARVTLGRALIEMNDLDAAETELTHVLSNAPENLAAIRGLAEIHHRRGELSEALVFYQNALSLARHDPDLEQAIDDISRAVAPPPEPEPVTDGMSFAEFSAQFMSAMDDVPLAERVGVALAEPDAVFPGTPEPAHPGTGGPGPAGAAEPPALPELERFLSAIHSYRLRR